MTSTLPTTTPKRVVTRTVDTSQAEAAETPRERLAALNAQFQKLPIAHNGVYKMLPLMLNEITAILTAERDNRK